MSAENRPASPRRDRAASITRMIPVFLEANADRIRTEQTIKSYKEILGSMAYDLNKSAKAVTEDDLVNWVRGNGRVLSPNWILNRRTRSQRFWRWMYEEEHIPKDPSMRLQSLVRPPSKNVRTGAWLTPAEALEMIHSCPSTMMGARDRFVLSLLLFTGMRMFEALGLTWADVDMKRREISFVGKGDKPGMVAIPDQLLDEMARWLTLADGEVLPSHPVVNTIRCGWARRDGVDEWVEWENSISRSGLRNILYRASDRIGRQVRPHDMRRSLAGILDDMDMPIDEIASVLRHNSTATTVRYLKANPRKGVDAMRGFRLA